MSVQEIDRLAFCIAVGVVWLGMQVLGGMLTRVNHWKYCIGVLAQFPLLCGWIGIAEQGMRYVKGIEWGSIFILPAVFGLLQLFWCKREGLWAMLLSLMPILVAWTAVGLALSTHILMKPELLGMLRYSVYDYSIPFYWSLAMIAAAVFVWAGLFVVRDIPLWLKWIVATGMLIAGILWGVGAFLRGIEVSDDMGAFSRNIVIFTVMTVALDLIAVFYPLSRARQAAFEKQLWDEKKRFEEDRQSDAEAVWANVRKVRHDIKQHLTVLSCYLQEGKTDECRAYLDELLGKVEKMGNLIQSGNWIIDYLINSKLGNLMETEVVIAGSVGDLSDIADGDLASILGNLLDNAVDGVVDAPQKRIELHFATENSNRILICKNTVKSSVLAANPKLLSTKSGGTHLGLGTRIIRETVAKYNGMTDFFEDHEMFCVQIVLPITSVE